MKVTLINSTPDALETLLFTKSTRLKMSATSMDEIKVWPEEKKMAELKYMLGTIKSSWEFVDLIFLIEGVTRAFTHQLVRHRAGTAFAQQSQRTVDMEGFSYLTTGSILESDVQHDIYSDAMMDISRAYEELTELGAKPEDARGILPTNICTSIVFKANLRTLHQMCSERLCVKAQREFQTVMLAIRKIVVDKYEWAEPMLRVHCATTGVCCFTSFKDCPIKGGTFDAEKGHRFDGAIGHVDTKEEIHEHWLRMMEGD